MHNNDTEGTGRYKTGGDERTDMDFEDLWDDVGLWAIDALNSEDELYGVSYFTTGPPSRGDV